MESLCSSAAISTFNRILNVWCFCFYLLSFGCNKRFSYKMVIVSTLIYWVFVLTQACVAWNHWLQIAIKEITKTKNSIKTIFDIFVYYVYFSCWQIESIFFKRTIPSNSCLTTSLFPFFSFRQHCKALNRNSRL